MALLFPHDCKNVSEWNPTRDLLVPSAEINRILFYNPLGEAIRPL